MRREALDAGTAAICSFLNEKELLSKQMGFLNIETAACLLNTPILNPFSFYTRSL
jgi:hypothetical protein